MVALQKPPFPEMRPHLDIREIIAFVFQHWYKWHTNAYSAFRKYGYSLLARLSSHLIAMHEKHRAPFEHRPSAHRAQTERPSSTDQAAIKHRLRGHRAQTEWPSRTDGAWIERSPSVQRVVMVTHRAGMLFDGSSSHIVKRFAFLPLLNRPIQNCARGSQRVITKIITNALLSIGILHAPAACDI